MIDARTAGLHIIELEDGIADYRNSIQMYDQYIHRFMHQVKLTTDRDTLELLELQIHTSKECQKVLRHSIEINENIIVFYERKLGMGRLEIISLLD